jgi:hypothetical protein
MTQTNHGANGCCLRRTRSRKEGRSKKGVRVRFAGDAVGVSNALPAKRTLTPFFDPVAFPPLRQSVWRRMCLECARQIATRRVARAGGDRRVDNESRRMRDETMRSVDDRNAGSVRRTVRRHGWRRPSAQGWLERVRRTDPASRSSPPTQGPPRDATFAYLVSPVSRGIPFRAFAKPA